jgi:hypothetical protein
MTGSHHFNENDEVYAVGAATQKAGDRPRLFADGFTAASSDAGGDSPCECRRVRVRTVA